MTRIHKKKPVWTALVRCQLAIIMKLGWFYGKSNYCFSDIFATSVPNFKTILMTLRSVILRIGKRSSCFFFPEGGVGLVPKRGCLLFTLAYYAFPRWYEFEERRWNDILTWENRRTRRKTCTSATLSTTHPVWIDPGANLDLRGVRPATNDLSHSTACSSC
jgi:hypothetical protein